MARSRAELVGICIVAVILVTGGVAAWRQAATLAIVLPRQPAPAAAAPGADKPAPPPLVVHVAGAVAKPGVYRLTPGARVADAVDAAGGPAPGAAVHAVNLAAPVWDGERVYLPTARELASGQVHPGTTVQGQGKVNINTADGTLLQALPGIGPALSQRILNYRKEHGPFRSAEDLLNVSGIGEKKLNDLRAFITLR